MKAILESRSVENIHKYFFKSQHANSLNISGVAENQIKKHCQVLSSKNKYMVQGLLRDGKLMGRKPY